MTSNMITTKQAIAIIAERSGKPMSARQLRHEIQTGHLKAEKIANTYFINRHDLETYSRRHPGKQAQPENLE